MPSNEQLRYQGVQDGQRAQRETARAAVKTEQLTQALLDAQRQMLEAQTTAEAREVKMLFWTRVAGIGAVAALAVSLLAIAITVLVA